MPTYEYRCPNCGKFEVEQKITDDPLKTCPTCGSSVNKLISRNVGIIFKGSGWYCTDNRKSSSSSSESEDSSSESSSSSSSKERKVS